VKTLRHACTPLPAALDCRGIGRLLCRARFNKGGFANNLWVQMAALVIVTLVVIALAAKYVW
jgi:hypothetical protein